MADSLEEAVTAGDIVSVAASSLKPIQLEDEWLRPGSLLIFSGRCNVAGDYYTSSKIVWDNVKMHETYYAEHLLLPENERSAGLLKKCGFTYEGRARKSEYIKGKYIDIDTYAILKDEYFALKGEK